MVQQIDTNDYISKFWESNDNTQWLNEEKHYWDLVKPENIEVEKQMDTINSEAISKMSAEEFYYFLHEKYFVWKYTAPNRLATTRNQLRKHLESLSELGKIQKQIFTFDKNNIKVGLQIATQIKGLGIAGASGMLAVLFPRYFGTVDQFVVKSLSSVNKLAEHENIIKMNPDSLTLRNGEQLIRIMRNKANELNVTNKTDYWTPRKIDKIFWVIGR